MRTMRLRQTQGSRCRPKYPIYRPVCRSIRTNELISTNVLGYNRYFLQREIQRVNNIKRIEALNIRARHFHIGQTGTCSLRYHLQPSHSLFHFLHHSQTLSHLNFTPPPPPTVAVTSLSFLRSN